MRWGKFGFDYLKSNGVKFAQYHVPKSKIRWFMIKPKAVRDPMFIKSHGWITLKNYKVIKHGITTKPLDLRKYWRADDYRNEARVRQQGNGAVKLVQ